MKANLGLVDRYARHIAGVLRRFDRLVMTGTLREIACPEAMDTFLYGADFRAFDIGRFADPLRQKIRDGAVALAQEAGIEIECLSRRKEELGLVETRRQIRLETGRRLARRA